MQFAAVWHDSMACMQLGSTHDPLTACGKLSGEHLRIVAVDVDGEGSCKAPGLYETGLLLISTGKACCMGAGFCSDSEADWPSLNAALS